MNDSILKGKYLLVNLRNLSTSRTSLSTPFPSLSSFRIHFNGLQLKKDHRKIPVGNSLDMTSKVQTTDLQGVLCEVNFHQLR